MGKSTVFTIVAEKEPALSLKVNIYVSGTEPPEPVKDAIVTPMILIGVDPETGEEQWWRIEAKRAKTDEYGVALIYDLGPQIYAVEIRHSNFRTTIVTDINLIDYTFQEVTVDLEPVSLLEKILPLIILGSTAIVVIIAVSKA